MALDPRSYRTDFATSGLFKQSFFILMMATQALQACKPIFQNHRKASELTAISKVCPGPTPGQVPTAEMIRNIAGVTDNEVKAVQGYTSDTIKSSIVKEILQCVTKEQLDDYCFFGKKFLDLASEFQSAVQKISKKMPFTGVVYRGIVVSKKAAENIKKQVGKTMGLAEEGKTAYVSSSRSQNFADEWLRVLEDAAQDRLGSQDTAKILYIIHQCRGASIEAIDTPTRGARQKEVILPPSKYKFASTRSAGGILYLTLFEAGCGGSLGLTSDSGMEGSTPASDPFSPSEDSDSAADADFTSHENLAALQQFVEADHVQPDSDGSTSGFFLTGQCVTVDQKARQKAKSAVVAIRKAVLQLNRAKVQLQKSPADQLNPALKQVTDATDQARIATRQASSAIKKMKFVGGKIIPVVGAVAEVAGTALGIVEAVHIKQEGGSDAAAAATVLEGWGMAGAIASVVAACEDGCDDDERACSFFRGLMGIDFCAQANCNAGYEAVGCCICRQKGCQPLYDDLGATCHRGAQIVSADNSGCPWHDKCGLTTAKGCSKCEDASFRNDGCTCRRDPHSYSKKILWKAQ